MDTAGITISKIWVVFPERFLISVQFSLLRRKFSIHIGRLLPYLKLIKLICRRCELLKFGKVDCLRKQKYFRPSCLIGNYSSQGTDFPNLDLGCSRGSISSWHGSRKISKEWIKSMLTPIKCGYLIYIFITSESLQDVRGTQQQSSENICSEDDLRSRIFGTFVLKFLACLPVLGFSNICKMYNCPFLTDFYPKKVT